MAKKELSPEEELQLYMVDFQEAMAKVTIRESGGDDAVVDPDNRLEDVLPVITMGIMRAATGKAISQEHVTAIESLARSNFHDPSTVKLVDDMSEGFKQVVSKHKPLIFAETTELALVSN